MTKAPIDRYLDEDTFLQRVPLRANHLTNDAPFDGCMFETYGEELAFVRQQNMRYIWTIVDGDRGLAIVRGFFFVNRIGYLISTTPVEDGFSYTVELADNSDATT